MGEPSLKKLALEDGEVQITSAAKAMWKLVRDLPDEGQRIVLAALNLRLEGPRVGPAQEQAVRALQKCLAEAGTTSRTIYSSWREGVPDPGAWPTAKVVHRAFGSWQKARESVGDANPSQPADHRLWLLPDATAQQLMEQLGVWLAEQPAGGPWRKLDYMSWLAERQSLKQTECLFPRSGAAVRRRIGPWLDALRRAGHVEVVPDSPFAEVVCERLDFQQLAPVEGHYDRARLAGWACHLREVLGTADLIALTRSQYVDLREVIINEAWDRQIQVEVASFGTIHVVTGSWIAFKALAGIKQSVREPSNGRTGSPRFAIEAIADAVCDCADQFGENFTTGEYGLWREREADSGRLRPSMQLIYSRLECGRGGWLEASKQVIGDV